jgi:Flp pilus assembly protein TadG
VCKGSSARALAASRAEGGQTLVEFALLLPLLLLVLFGTIEFGRVFLSYLDVAEAAHEADRIVSLGGTTTQATAAAQAAAQAAGLDPTKLTVGVNGTLDAGGNWVVGTSVSTSVGYPVPIVVPLFWPILGQTFAISASVSMLEEG